MNVLLVVMPFGSVRPSIGVSLLKSHLARIHVASRVLYLNMPYARLVGPTLYNDIAQEAPAQSLAGDWIFRSCLWEGNASADERYLQEYGARFSNTDRSSVSRNALELCRSMAEPFVSDCLASVNWESYDVVGFTSTFAQHVGSLALAKRVKEKFPKIKIAFGGANCEDTMGLQTHRSFPFIDFVCSGEADRSFPKLVQSLLAKQPLAGINGVISRCNGVSIFSGLTPESEVRLDALPTPDYTDYFEQLKQYELETVSGGGLLMESSRGCWWGQKHHCTFCGLNGTSMSFRSKSASRVVEEIDELVDRFHELHFAMVDNILDMKYFYDLLPTLRMRRVKLSLFYETKANLTKSHLRMMKDAGIEAIQPGIESLSNNVLRLMRKGTTALQNIQLLKWCKEIGIVPHWNLLYGFPDEKPSDYQMMAQLIDALHHLDPPHCIDRIRLDRFSPNFFDASRLGIVNIRADRSYSHVYDLPELEVAEMAYFFDHQYADGRDPESYVGCARDAVNRWRATPANRGLIYVDHGDRLAIWDFRPHRTRIVTILNGAERAIYLYCDQHRSLQQIVAHVDAEGKAASIVQMTGEWIASRIMVGVEGQYLALAIQAEVPACTEDMETVPTRAVVSPA